MKCCVPGCVGDVANSGFPLPTAAVRRLKWLRIIKIPGGNFPEAKVCGKHFKPEDFETVEDYKSIEEKKVLKSDAVPTVFASGKPKTKTKPSLMGERMRFRQRTQRPAEAIESFIHSLQAMASSCGFCNESCLRDNLLEQLIAGIHDRAVVRKLLDLPNLDLETALGVCAASREAETKNVRFDPLAVVKVEQGATSDGEEIVDEMDMKEEEEGDEEEEDMPEVKRDSEGMTWDTEIPHGYHLVEEDEYDDGGDYGQTSHKKHNLKRDRSNVSRTCHLCGFSAKTDVDLVAHGRDLHGGERMFRCPECDFAGVKRNALDQHMTSRHGARNILCPHCPRKLSTEASLRAHIRLKHDGKTDPDSGSAGGQCPHCDFVSKGRFLQRHIENRHPDKVEGGLDLKCKSCDFVGSAMRDLRTHVILLHKNKGIKCPHCDYFTYPKSSIDKHVKRVHEKSAVPEKICETCGKAFWQESKLQAHILKDHEKTAPYKCEQCEFATHSPLWLKRHVQRVHDKVRNYLCTHCAFTAFTRQKLNIHISRMHKDVIAR